MVESIEELEIVRLHDPLETELSRHGAEVRVVSSPAVKDLRDPSVSGELLRMGPDALLVVDIDVSMLVLGELPSTSLDYSLSLYQYTEDRMLVEVWKAGGTTARMWTTNRALGADQAEALAEVLALELQKSELLVPCQPVL